MVGHSGNKIIVVYYALVNFTPTPRDSTLIFVPTSEETDVCQSPIRMYSPW